MLGSEIGVIGLGVMGKNIALNLDSRGIYVAAYNRTYSKTNELIKENPRISGFKSIGELCNALETPRKLLVIVSAGDAVDRVLEEASSCMKPGDIIVDGGNSFFEDTTRRSVALEGIGIHFGGCGISGGEEGALRGPSIMFGGSEDAWNAFRPLLEKISAKYKDGAPCCTYFGTGGAEHYVKMVHNGIEYIDMQLISEAYHMLKSAGLSNEEIADVFKLWNTREMGSYLIEITSKIFRKKDGTDNYVIDIISDEAEQKGTGIWAAKNSLDIGVPAYGLCVGVMSRFISKYKKERVAASKLLPKKYISTDNTKTFIENVYSALYASKICAYAQGFDVLSSASKKYGWNINMKSVASVWRGGCIIRANMLDRIADAFRSDLPNLLTDSYLLGEIQKNDAGWRAAVSVAAGSGIPVPGLYSSLSYYDGYFTDMLPTNLIQAQRDFFGAHTYRRNDKEGIFHTEWETK